MHKAAQAKFSSVSVFTCFTAILPWSFVLSLRQFFDVRFAAFVYMSRSNSASMRLITSRLAILPFLP